MKTLHEFLNGLNTEIDLNSAYFEGDTFEEFSESVNRIIFETEIIYYSKAIEFLAENDPSLNESLSLASDMGYTTENLNSEVLATLLHQSLLMDEWNEISGEVEEFFIDNEL